MSRRTTSTGRVLKTGESERKDGIFQYRYTDHYGKRKTVYAGTLKELRQKEDEILRSRVFGTSSKENITVSELANRFLTLKSGTRTQTLEQYRSKIKIFNQYPLFGMKLNNVRPSDVKEFLIQLKEEHQYSFLSIKNMHMLLHAIMNVACEDNMIPRNPAAFKITSLFRQDSSSREALTPQQQEALLTFLSGHKIYEKYYDQTVILMGTGLRASEYCGLTIPDIDFENRRIHVSRQLYKDKCGNYHYASLKTATSQRYIPMKKDVIAAFERQLAIRKEMKNNLAIDGHTDFVFITKQGTPKTLMTVGLSYRSISSAYNASNPEIPIVVLTPHVLRHTFCTNMVASGMDIKSLQYLMGHSSINMTLDLYAHFDIKNIEDQMLD